MSADEQRKIVQAARTDGVLRDALSHPVGAPASTRFPAVPPPFMSQAEFSADLKNIVLGAQDKKHGASESPFYGWLFAGKVPREGLKTWIKQWYFEARSFPPLVAQVIAGCGWHYDIRQMMGANLYEELGEGNPAREHPHILKKIGRALGVSEEEMEFVEPIAEVAVFVEYRHKLVRDANPIEAVAAAGVATELMLPKRYPLIGKALKEHYGLAHDDLEFLWIHAGDPNVQGDYGGDIEHAGEALGVLTKYCTTGELQEQARHAIRRSLDGRRVYQWGLFRACVLAHSPELKNLIEVS
jgi:pyrroloquinoline-quinone synthase